MADMNHGGSALLSQRVKPATSPATVSVTDLANYQGSAIANLYAAVENLEKQLSALLSPTPPSENSGMGPQEPSSCSYLASTLRGNITGIEALTARIISLQTRIEV